MSGAVSRIRLGPLHNPVRGLLHGSAAILAAAAAGEFAAAQGAAPELRAALVTFGLSAAALFTVSTLYHALPWNERWKRRMQRADHAMIYCKIAGVSTAFAVAGLRGAECDLVIAAAWGIAALGTAQKAWLPDVVHEKASIPFQVLQSLVAVPALLAFSERFPDSTPVLAIACALYAVGAVIFVSERPRLWPRVFSFHELFHGLVVAGFGLLWLLLSDVLAAAAGR